MLRAYLPTYASEVLRGPAQYGGKFLLGAHLLPLKKDAAREIVFANGSRIRARGFGTRVRGGHPWWVVCDDVGNDEWIWSDTVRRKSIDYFLSAIESMPVPGGQLVVVGTPFHAQDLYSHLEETGVFHVVKDPAIDDEGKPLWPARYDATALARKKKTLGSELRWSREFLCRPISDEASLFPTQLFEGPIIRRQYQLGLDAEYWRMKGIETYMGVDLALSASAAADWFVALVLGIDPEGNRWLIDIIRRKGLGYQAQVDIIVSAARKYGCGLVFCEANQFQRVITDMVVRTSDAPIKAFYTTGRGGSKQVSTQRRGMTKGYSANKNALDQGVPGIRMLFENHKFRIPWNESTRELVKVWMGEMQAFGWVDGKLQGVGAHDDTVMALWMADRAVAVGGSFSLGFADDDGEGDPWDELTGEAEEDDIDYFGGGGLDPADIDKARLPR